jgi:hypothetical protein
LSNPKHGSIRRSKDKWTINHPLHWKTESHLKEDPSLAKQDVTASSKFNAQLLASYAYIQTHENNQNEDPALAKQDVTASSRCNSAMPD